MRAATLVLIPALLVFPSACTVSRPGLDDRVYPCATDADCLAGFDCADRSMLGLPGFCAPSCDPLRPASTCPGGECLPEGACVPRCVPQRDGTLLIGCPAGLTCVRTDVFRDEGVCWQVSTCSVNSDCDTEAGPASCMSDVLGLPALVPGLPIGSNRLFCIDAPVGAMGDRCRPGTIPLRGSSTRPGACLPTCNDTGDRCPPGMSCWRDLGWLFQAVRQSVCWVGTWGSPCEADTDCMFGTCIEIGDRSICTEHCDDVPIAGDCSALGSGTGTPGTTVWTCTAVGADSVCVPQGGIGVPCNGDRRCLDALGCQSILEENSGLCSKPCVADADCYIEAVPEPERYGVYCDTTQSFCFAQRPQAATCTANNQCRSGNCAAGLCGPPRT